MKWPRLQVSLYGIGVACPGPLDPFTGVLDDVGRYPDGGAATCGGAWAESALGSQWKMTQMLRRLPRLVGGRAGERNLTALRSAPA